jgi:hypothetical protein
MGFLAEGLGVYPAMVPFKAASREKGAEEEPMNEGGSRRVVRRRLDSIFDRFPWVGDRPAGGGQDLGVAFSELGLLKHDFALRMRRGVEAALTGAEDRAGVLTLGVRKKLEGLRASLELTPLERLEKSSGSTFSQLSISRNSALRFGETGAAERWC